MSGVGLDVARRAPRRPCRRAGRASWCVDVHLERDLLQVEDDVGRVLDHARDRRELVQHAVDLDRGDRRALDRGEQHAAQRVADRRAEPALERLRVEAAEPVGEGLALELEPLRPLKTFPQHVSVFLSVERPAWPPPDLPLSPASRRRPGKAAGGGPRSCRDLQVRPTAYFEYSSTMSCSCTGRLICSRVGSEATRPRMLAGVEREPLGHAASLHLLERVLDRRVLARCAPRTPTTSPGLTG